MGTARFVALSVALGIGCGGGPYGVDSGRHDASVDADLDAGHDAGHDANVDANCLPPELYDAYACRDGRIFETQCAFGHCQMCTTLERMDVACVNGCLDSPAPQPQQPLDVCRPLASVGTPCTTDAHCAHAADDAGFGGPPVPPTLHCDTAHGICASDTEACNAADDDLDGAIDEGCTCMPRSVLSGVGGIPSEVGFGPDRMLATTWSDLGSALSLVDTDGVVQASFAIAAAASPVRIDGGFLYLEIRGAEDYVLRRIGDDGLRFGIDVPFTWSGGGLRAMRPWGADFLVLALGVTPAVGRVDGSGNVVSRTAIDVTDARLTMLADGTPLVIDAPAGAAIRGLTLTTDVRAHEVATGSTDRVGPIAELATTAGRIWLAAHDAGGDAVLSAIDAGTGAWAETISLGTIVGTPDTAGATTTTLHLAAHGEHLFVSWRDVSGALRVVVVDTSGTRLGQASVPLGGPGLLLAGDTGHGVRLVSGSMLFAPCDAL